MDKRDLEKLKVYDGPGSVHRLVTRVCDVMDSDRRCVAEIKGDTYLLPKLKPIPPPPQR